MCGNTDFNLGTGLFEGFLENEMLSYCDTAYLVYMYELGLYEVLSNYSNRKFMPRAFC